MTVFQAFNGTGKTKESEESTTQRASEGVADVHIVPPYHHAHLHVRGAELAVVAAAAVVAVVVVVVVVVEGGGSIY